MDRSRRVVLGMSGGVDSSVAGFLLKQGGYEVFGLMLRTWRMDQHSQALTSKEQDAFESAQKSAARVGIPLEMADTRQPFFQHVIGYFKKAYTSGLTPNPCMVCNRDVKFATLLAYADRIDAQWIATGHYVRLAAAGDDVKIVKARDTRKDQTYFLSHLNQEILRRTIFPLSDLTKDEVREIARQNGIEAVYRPESQDLCFLEGTDYRQLMMSLDPEAFTPGEIIDVDGNVVGQHTGLANYTIGQRKGLGVFRAKPLYVLNKIPEQNQLIVAYEEQLGNDRFWVEQVNWIVGRPPAEEFGAWVKIRYQAKARSARIRRSSEEGLFLVTVDEPLRDVTPGQFAVFYDGDTLLGGGTISAKSIQDPS